jgi:hypothetical protein
MTGRRPSAGDRDAQEWHGPWRRYDLVKEGVVALVVVSLLTVGLSALLSSPDEPPLTFKGWATSAPDNFYATTVAELAGTSESAGYGPPYNTNGDGVAVGPLNLQKLMGVRIPVDPAQDFVITPLSSRQQPSEVTTALAAWTSASPDRRTAWATAYDDAIAATADDSGEIDLAKVATGEFGPVPVLAKGLTDMAASGGYDGVLLAHGGFYQTDNTRQILFMGDGSYLDDAATAANLQGNTWGMMNETGSWPGQAWLWAYSLWYQLPMFNAADDATGFSATLTGGADAIIFYLMVLLSLLLLLVPFIPGLRSVPRWIPVHRLIWRRYYRSQGHAMR